MDYDLLRHHCKLEPQRDIVERNTPPGFLYKLRLRIRKSTMSSDTCQLAKLYYKSNYTVRFDRKRQFTQYYWTIHPLSDFAAKWEVVGGFVLLLFIITLPFCEFYPKGVWRIMRTILQFMLLIDVFLRFFKGYVDKKSKRIVLDKKRICLRYLRTYFIFDFISAVPLYLIPYTFTRRLSDIFAIFRIIRLINTTTYLRTQQIRYDFPTFVVKVVGIGLLYFSVIWAMFLFLAVKKSRYDQDRALINPSGADRTSNSAAIIGGFYRCVFLVLLLGVPAKNIDESLTINTYLAIVAICVGCMFRFTVISLFLQIVAQSKSPQRRYDIQMGEVNDFSKSKQLPSRIERRIKAYYYFKYQGGFYSERTIQYVLTTHLQQLIKVHKLKQAIQRIDLFANMPKSLLIPLTLAFEIKYHLSNDILMEYGRPSDSMYIISKGSIALYDGANHEICHLEDNCYFGEINIIFGTDFSMPHAVAISACELFVLSKQSFDQVMAGAVKEEQNKLALLARTRLQQAMQVMQMRGYDFLPPRVIVEEILEKPIDRPTYQNLFWCTII